MISKFGCQVKITKVGSFSEVASGETIGKVVDEKNNEFLYFRAIFLHADIPNGNGDMFPKDEILKSYGTFIGKHLDLNHSQEMKDMVGKIIDVYTVEDPDTKDCYVEGLCKIDRKANPEIARQIETGILDSVSMEASVEESECSICGCKIHTEMDAKCEHFKGGLNKSYEVEVEGKKESKKCFAINRGCTFTGLGIVNVPADGDAKILSIISAMREKLNKTAASDVVSQTKLLEEIKTLMASLSPETKSAVQSTVCNIESLINDDEKVIRNAKSKLSGLEYSLFISDCEKKVAGLGTKVEKVKADLVKEEPVVTVPEVKPIAPELSKEAGTEIQQHPKGKWYLLSTVTMEAVDDKEFSTRDEAIDYAVSIKRWTPEAGAKAKKETQASVKPEYKAIFIRKAILDNSYWLVLKAHKPILKVMLNKLWGSEQLKEYESYVTSAKYGENLIENINKEGIEKLSALMVEKKATENKCPSCDSANTDKLHKDLPKDPMEVCKDCGWQFLPGHTEGTPRVEKKADAELDTKLKRIDELSAEIRKLLDTKKDEDYAKAKPLIAEKDKLMSEVYQFNTLDPKDPKNPPKKVAGYSTEQITKEQFKALLKKNKYECTSASTVDMLANPMKYVNKMVQFELSDHTPPQLSARSSDGQQADFLVFEQVENKKVQEEAPMAKAEAIVSMESKLKVVKEALQLDDSAMDKLKVWAGSCPSCFERTYEKVAGKTLKVEAKEDKTKETKELKEKTLKELHEETHFIDVVKGKQQWDKANRNKVEPYTKGDKVASKKVEEKKVGTLTKEESAFDIQETIIIGDGYTAKKDKETKTIQIMNSNGEEIGKYVDGFGEDIVSIMKLLRQILGLPIVEEDEEKGNKTLEKDLGPTTEEVVKDPNSEKLPPPPVDSPKPEGGTAALIPTKINKLSKEDSMSANKPVTIKKADDKGDYQGWKNYETWMVALMINNDQGESEMWRETIEDNPTIEAFELGDMIKNSIEESSPLNDANTIHSGLLSAAIGNVDFREIGTSLIKDYKDEVAYQEGEKGKKPVVEPKSEAPVATESKPEAPKPDLGVGGPETITPKKESLSSRIKKAFRMRKASVEPKKAETSTDPKIKERLESLRKALQAENISYGELAELQSLKEYIEPGDVELLEAAGVPEFPGADEMGKDSGKKVTVKKADVEDMQKAKEDKGSEKPEVKEEKVPKSKEDKVEDKKPEDKSKEPTETKLEKAVEKVKTDLEKVEKEVAKVVKDESKKEKEPKEPKEPKEQVKEEKPEVIVDIPKDAPTIGDEFKIEDISLPIPGMASAKVEVKVAAPVETIAPTTNVIPVSPEEVLKKEVEVVVVKVDAPIVDAKVEPITAPIAEAAGAKVEVKVASPVEVADPIVSVPVQIVKSEAELKAEAEKAALELKVKETEAKLKVAEEKSAQDRMKAALEAKAVKVDSIVKEMMSKGLISADSKDVEKFQKAGNHLLDARNLAFKLAMDAQKASLFKMDKFSIEAFQESILKITKVAGVTPSEFAVISNIKMDKVAGSDENWMSGLKWS